MNKLDPITRRDFILHAALALAGGTAGAQVAKPDAPPIIDTHQHLWDLSQLNLPWLKPGGELTRNFTLDVYEKATAGLNIVKSIYMEVAAVADQKEKEAELIVDLCRRRRAVPCAAVIGGDPAGEKFPEYIRKFSKNPEIKGLRHIPAAPRNAPHPYETSPFIKGMQWLGELNLSFDLCVAPALLSQCAALVDACPATRFILDHCGNADPKQFGKNADEAARREADAWRRGMDDLGKRERGICKISGIVARADKAGWSAADLAPVVNHCREAFGPDRIVFGSDWPVCTRVAQPAEWVRALKEIIAGWPPADQRALLHDNAARFYRV